MMLPLSLVFAGFSLASAQDAEAAPAPPAEDTCAVNKVSEECTDDCTWHTKEFCYDKGNWPFVETEHEEVDDFGWVEQKAQRLDSLEGALETLIYTNLIPKLTSLEETTNALREQLSNTVQQLESRVEKLEEQKPVGVALVTDKASGENFLFWTETPEAAFADLVKEAEMFREDHHLEEDPAFTYEVAGVITKVTDDDTLKAAFMATKDSQLVLKAIFATKPPTKSPTEEPTPTPTGAPSPFPTPSPTDAPTEAPTKLTPKPTEAPTPAPTPARIVFESKHSEDGGKQKIEAFMYEGDAKPLTWDMQYEVCEKHGLRVPGSSNAKAVKDGCSYTVEGKEDAEVTVVVTNKCHWAGQAFTHISGAIPEGKNGYACAFKNCRFSRMFMMNKSKPVRSKVPTISEGDYVMCEYKEEV